MLGKFAKKEAAAYRKRTRASQEFKDHIISMIHNLGRDGVDYALDILFEISNLVLRPGLCDHHRMNRIRNALSSPEVSDFEN